MLTRTLNFNLAFELRYSKDQLRFATSHPNRSQASLQASPKTAVKCTGWDRRLHSRIVVHTGHIHRSNIAPHSDSAQHLCRKLLLLVSIRPLKQHREVHTMPRVLQNSAADIVR